MEDSLPNYYSRDINLSPFNLISQLSRFDHHTITEISNCLVELDGIYFIINDETEKLSDISRMPLYIKEDWLNYNKKPIDISTVNKHIEFVEKWIKYPLSSIDTLHSEYWEELLKTLKSLRRELIINGIL